jgi:hypothetical protein
MKRLSLDFIQRRLWQLPVAGRERQLLIGLALVAVVAGGAIIAKCLLLDRAIEQAALAIAVAQQEVERRTPVRQAPLVLSKPQVVAINRIIAQLNTPWPVLLDGFERVAGADIALLQIEPDHRRRRQGVAEAKESSADARLPGTARLGERRLSGRWSAGRRSTRRIPTGRCVSCSRRCSTSAVRRAATPGEAGRGRPSERA